MNTKANLLPFIAFLAFATATNAQITIVDSGATGNQVNLSGTYTQNFDSLFASTPPGGVAWQNNVTIPGWYSSQSSYSANGINGGLASYGTDSDRALGSVAAFWALRFLNESSQDIIGFSIGYDVEQWYRAANSPQLTNPLRLYYRIYPGSWTVGNELATLGVGSGWNEVLPAIFFTPNSTGTTASMLNGNLPENRGEVNVVIDGIVLAPGEKLWLRWLNGEDVGNDHALAIDNLNFSFSTAPIPEPASAAALLGLAALATTTARRLPRSWRSWERGAFAASQRES